LAHCLFELRDRVTARTGIPWRDAREQDGDDKSCGHFHDSSPCSNTKPLLLFKVFLGLSTRNAASGNRLVRRLSAAQKVNVL
jgi:hypothetical protein